MLLTLLSFQGGGIPPTGSTSGGVLCIEAYVLIDQLEASVLIAELEQTDPGPLATTVVMIELEATLPC